MGQTGAASGSAGMPTTTAADTANYPKCSRTVTDKCVQSAGMRKTAMKKRRR